ncbi:MAG: glycosyltransferase family 4 protein [Saprospiraceae bacterium]
MIYLVAPDPASFISGGNRFNQQILNGLSSLGLAYKRIDFVELDESKTNEENIVIFDSLYIEQLSIHLLNRIKAKKVFLIHLLSSMVDRRDNISNEQTLLSGFDLIIANSVFTKDYCTQTLGLVNNIAIVQPFIEKNQKIRDHSFRHKFIHVANWVPEKQIDLFLLALAKHKLPEDFSIYFYGDLHRSEEYFDHCKSVMDEYPDLKKHIHLTGILSHAMLLEEYEHAKLMIDTSSMETYGMAVAEAIAHGVPVISLGNGNTKLLINKSNGIVVKNMDEMVISILSFYRGELRFDQPDSVDIITEWSLFSNQLIQIIKA